MSVRTITKPEYGLRCDRCGEIFDAPGTLSALRQDGAGLRSIARASGWQVRPMHGKGSRTAPDFCPACAVLTGGESR